MGFISLIAIAFAFAVGALAALRILFFINKKEMTLKVVLYGVVLSVCAHLGVVASLVSAGSYWVFLPIFRQVFWLTVLPFLCSAVLMISANGKLNQLQKIGLSAITTFIASYFLFISDSSVLVFVAVLIFSIIPTFIRPEIAKFLEKVILVSIVCSLILGICTFAHYDDFLSMLGAKGHY